NLLKPQPSATAATTAPPPSASTAPPPVPSTSAHPLPTTTASSGPPPPAGKPFGIAPWVTVGVVGPAVVAGAVLLPLGLNAVKSAQKNCQDQGGGTWACPDNKDIQKAKSGQTQVLVGKIALGVGGAAVAGGLVWELLFNKPAPAASEPPAGTAP